jgi:glycosyltransferase involved in cell wall biosynthesis
MLVNWSQRPMSSNTKNNRVLYLQYTNPAAYPPLQHSSRLLADAGWEVLFLGTHAAGADALEFPPHPRIRVLRMSFCPGGWRQKLHYLKFVVWSFWWTLRWRPQWVYASDPLSATAALVAGLFPSVCLLYHEHDSPSGRPSSAFMRGTLALRKRLAKKADVIVLPNAQRAEVFSSETIVDPAKVQCVWNCPASGDALPEPNGKQVNETWLHYHGNISPQLVPLTVIDALAMLPPAIKLRVIGYETVSTAGYMNELREKAVSLCVDKRIDLRGAMNRDELLLWTRKAHIGLALMPVSSINLNMRHMAGASNKPFDYLACGCPLLVSALPDWDTMFVQNKMALSCNPDSPESIADAVRWYFEHPSERAAMGEAGRQRILNEWNYETQFKRIGKLLMTGTDKQQ